MSIVRLAFFVSFFVCTVVLRGAQQVRYSIQRIDPVAGQAGGEATDIDDMMRVVGTVGTVTGYATSGDGVARALPDFVGGFASRAEGVGALGHTLGASATRSGAMHATMWAISSGVITMEELLPAPGDFASIAEDANRFETVVGCTDDLFDFKPAVWRRSSGVFSVAPLPLPFGDTGGVAQAINDASRIVGFTGNFSRSRAVAWDLVGGSWQERVLPDLGGGTDAVDVADSGEIVGSAFVPGRGWGMAGWDTSGEAVDLGQFAGRDTRARGMNANGDVVGVAQGLAGTIAVVRLGGLAASAPVQDLNAMIPPRTTWGRLLRAHAINSQGQIVGSGDVGGFRQSFVLTPMQMRLGVSPASAGSVNSWAVNGATPGSLVFILLAMDGGETRLPGCAAPVNLRKPMVLGAAVADAAGVANLSLFLPDSLHGMRLMFQAVENGTCALSDVRDVTF